MFFVFNACDGVIDHFVRYQGIHIGKVFFLQAAPAINCIAFVLGVVNGGAVQFQRHRVVATGELCLDRGAVGTGDVLTREDDVGQARVLFVQGSTQER